VANVRPCRFMSAADTKFSDFLPPSPFRPAPPSPVPPIPFFLYQTVHFHSDMKYRFVHDIDLTWYLTSCSLALWPSRWTRTLGTAIMVISLQRWWWPRPLIVISICNSVSPDSQRKCLSVKHIYARAHTRTTQIFTDNFVPGPGFLQVASCAGTAPAAT